MAGRRLADCADSTTWHHGENVNKGCAWAGQGSKWRCSLADDQGVRGSEWKEGPRVASTPRAGRGDAADLSQRRRANAAPPRRYTYPTVYAGYNYPTSYYSKGMTPTAYGGGMTPTAYGAGGMTPTAYGAGGMTPTAYGAGGMTPTAYGGGQCRSQSFPEAADDRDGPGLAPSRPHGWCRHRRRHDELLGLDLLHRLLQRRLLLVRLGLVLLGLVLLGLVLLGLVLLGLLHRLLLHRLLRRLRVFPPPAGHGLLLLRQRVQLRHGLR